jgi:hypothetical protein
MSFQMLKRTRKRRGGDLYAGQLDPAIQAANELATVLQNIAQTLPKDTGGSSVPSASSASTNTPPNADASAASTNTPPNASTSDSNVPASSPAPAPNPAPSVIYNPTQNRDRPFFIDGVPFSSESIKTIIKNMLKLDQNNQKLKNISDVLNKNPPLSAVDIVNVLNDNKVHWDRSDPKVFTMSGGTKKRRMRRTKRKTMRRTMRKTMRKTQKKY